MYMYTGYPPFPFSISLPRSTLHSSLPALYSGRLNYINYVNRFPHPLASCSGHRRSTSRRSEGSKKERSELLEENIGRTLYDINHSKILFDSPPREMEIKTKINKWDLMKLKSFCTAKENINKMKRQPSEWEKRFANEATDKGLISKLYKQLMQLNIKKQTTQSKNGQKT